MPASLVLLIPGHRRGKFADVEGLDDPVFEMFPEVSWHLRADQCQGHIPVLPMDGAVGQHPKTSTLSTLG